LPSPRQWADFRGSYLPIVVLIQGLENRRGTIDLRGIKESIFIAVEKGKQYRVLTVAIGAAPYALPPPHAGLPAWSKTARAQLLLFKLSVPILVEL